MKTKVKFLFHEKSDELFALFPEQVNSNMLIDCYSLTDGHSLCDKGYARASVKATPEQYTPLQKELETIGYNLQIQ